MKKYTFEIDREKRDIKITPPPPGEYEYLAEVISDCYIMMIHIIAFLKELDVKDDKINKALDSLTNDLRGSYIQIIDRYKELQKMYKGDASNELH